MIKVKASYKTMLGNGELFTQEFDTTCRKSQRAIEAVKSYIVNRMRGFDITILDVSKA